MRTAEVAASGRNDREASSYPRIQFRIRHILWISIWVSLLLAAIRSFELDYRVVLPLFVGWLVYQATTLWIGGLLTKWFLGWKAGRQTRST